jgi:neutral ceramidase
VVNEYAGYVTTAEEYARQYYEGGHTLYGPHTQEFLARHVRRLAGDLAAATPRCDVVAERPFDLRLGRYFPVPTSPSGRPPERRFLDEPRFVDPTSTGDGYWEAEWQDVGPAELAWHEPLVAVEAGVAGSGWARAHHDGRPVDDAGWDLEVTHAGVEAAGHRYRVRWYDPAFGRRHRFVLPANAGRPSVVSPPFD